jgi:hypothetical protein
MIKWQAVESLAVTGQGLIKAFLFVTVVALGSPFFATRF